MLTIEYKKEEGLIVKHNGQLIEGVSNVKININSNVYKESPEVILTINPTDIRISNDIDCPKPQSNQSP
ncbi:hypothetical protein [Proteiniborus sp. MB09-C3]|uniref:hypothetical protein n=1 Tax=Proteiniborus sp. MB09-C3 TaxID=3050072 RepID=UPI00255416E1|nr:hypothetical protein [Proteiniborus sp. MB09-C3]WIV11132.1 hypothetical protein QO263_13365 [Proteiniborus sp. MB09-C3]